VIAGTVLLYASLGIRQVSSPVEIIQCDSDDAMSTTTTSVREFLLLYMVLFVFTRMSRKDDVDLVSGACFPFFFVITTILMPVIINRNWGSVDLSRLAGVYLMITVPKLGKLMRTGDRQICVAS
jgi:hypothetical protein